MLNHNYIGTEHVLLGLIHEGEGVAARSLESLGINLEDVRTQIETIIGQGQQAPRGHIPFTPRAKKVLELALREALQLGHNYIGTEHILLGLIREGEGVAAQILVKLGAELTRVRQQVIQLLSGYQGKETVEGEMTAETLERISKFEDQIVAARTLKEKAIDDRDFEKAASLRDLEKTLVNARSVLTDQPWPPSSLKFSPSVRHRAEGAVSDIINISKLLERHGINAAEALIIDLFTWRANGVPD